MAECLEVAGAALVVEPVEEREAEQVAEREEELVEEVPVEVLAEEVPVEAVSLRKSPCVDSFSMPLPVT